LIGREQELARLQAALHKAALGEGQVVFLSGEAGLGKSRLVAELKAQAAGVRWLTGRCRQSTASVSYCPFTEIVRLHLGWRPGADESTRSAAIECGLAELIGDGVLALDSVEETAAVLGALFAVRFGDRRDDLLRYADPGQMRHRTLVALSTLLLAICKDTQRPRPGANDPGNDESALRCAGGALVLVLEDLHWADALSLDLIRDLLSKVVGAPLLLLCVYRPEAREDCVRLPALAARRAPGATVEIRLHELAREETAHLVDAFFGRHRLPDDLFGWILERAQGNPFFAEETVRSLIDAGAIECENGVWRIARHVRRWDAAQRADTTPGIDSLILSRVGRLDPALRRVLQTASVVGMNFELPLLADLLPETTALVEQLHDLEQRDFLLCERMAPLPEYSFRHVLLREAIYKTLPPLRRVHLHWQAAQAIEAHFAADIEAQVEQLAHHYLQTDDHATAVRYLVRAGARARQAFLNEQARTFFELALQRCAMLGGGGPDAEHLALQADIWQQLGRVKYATGAFAEAERAFRAAMALGETAWDAHTLVRSVYWLGEVLFWQGKFEAMAESVGAAVDRLGPDDRSIEKALMYGHQFAAACMLGRDEEALDTLMQTASLVEGLPFCEELSSAYHHVVEYLILDEKDVSAANHWISLMAERAEANHDLNSLAKVFYAQTTLLETCGDMDAARLAATRGLELAHATGERTLIDFCVGRLGEIAFLTGDLAEAARRGRQLLAWEEGDSDAEQSDDAIPAYVLLGAGDVDTSLHLLQQTVKLETYSGSVPQQATLWLARAQRAAGLQSEAFTSARAGLLYGKPEMLGYPRMPLNRNVLAAFLTILDATTDDMAAFRAFCDDLRQNHPDVDDLHLCSWYLERSEPVSLPGLLLDERFDGDLPPGRWQWIDPTGRGACKVEDGLRIQAGEACDLWHLNRNAPRLLTPVAGDFAIQTTCTPATAGLPMGGLCLWGDADHFVRLDRGALGESEVSLMACIARRDHMIGRGRLPGDAMTLRLERLGRQVRGLCSAVGETWWRVGECEWPWQGAVAVGPFVVGL
ncbi:MAG: AAA family ATPase, partial [Caldilinea sp.]